MQRGESVVSGNAVIGNMPSTRKLTTITRYSYFGGSGFEENGCFVSKVPPLHNLNGNGIVDPAD